MLTIRLKNARQRAGFTQEQLGILIGIDEGSASARMNQYEKGKHVPDFLLCSKIADVLNIPVSYLYTPEDDLAELLLLLHKLNTIQRKSICDKIIHGFEKNE